MESDFHMSWYPAIAAQTRQQSYAAGDVIAMQGEALDYVGYIISGRATAVAYSEHGATTWVGYFGSSDFFGHVSLLTETETKFEICADMDVKALLIPANVMRDLLEQDRPLNSALTQDLAARLDVMTSQLIEAFTLSARGRVCAELARLSNIIGIMPEKHIIRPNPIFVDIAQRINSTRETVSRTVSELQKKGIIDREPGALIINSPERLKAAIQ